MKIEQLNLAIERICQNIGGDWLLLGGSLIRLDVDSARGTYDIDIVQIPLSLDAKSRTLLINEMKAIGLSPEQVNSSVSFFLGQIPNWEQQVVELMNFPNGRLLRPTLTLFSYLKLLRGTPIDLEDICKARDKWGKDEFDSKLFNSWANSEIQMKASKLGFQ